MWYGLKFDVKQPVYITQPFGKKPINSQISKKDNFLGSSLTNFMEEYNFKLRNIKFQNTFL